MILMERNYYGLFSLCDDFHFAFSWLALTDQHQLALLYVNPRRPATYGPPSRKQIDFLVFSWRPIAIIQARG
jgi:hypothetical protein